MCPSNASVHLMICDKGRLERNRAVANNHRAF